MELKNQSLEELKHIKAMMERSSRFISLSGFSGVAAGVCALVGAGLAIRYVHFGSFMLAPDPMELISNDLGTSLVRRKGILRGIMSSQLFAIAVGTFSAAFATAFLFTYFKSKKQGIPIWGAASYRLMVNVAIPMLAGGVFCIKLIETGNFGLLAPATLIFYGLALLNASKYTFVEIRYLGLCMVLLGFVNCWNLGYGLYFWSLGFGVLHIVYGLYMWWVYERQGSDSAH